MPLKAGLQTFEQSYGLGGAVDEKAINNIPDAISRHESR